MTESPVRIRITEGNLLIYEGAGPLSISTVQVQPPQQPPPDPEPEPLPRALLGVHCVHSTTSLKKALAAGCKFAVTFENITSGLEAARANPDALIVIRNSFPRYIRPTHQEVLDRVGPYPDWPSNALVVALNEQDGSPKDVHFYDEIESRYAWDVEFARLAKLRNPNVLYLASVYPPACNEEGERRYAETMQRTYAQGYNAGLFGIDYHAYGQTGSSIYSNAAWFERRWWHLFECCGFDIAAPHAKGVWFTECGVDQGSVGGFNELKFTEQQFREWLTEFVRITYAPVTVGGKVYPSPVRGAAIFQYGEYADRGGWKGYETEQFHEVYKLFWQGITPEPEPQPEPVYSIAVDRTTITQGQPVTITMHFEHVGGAWFKLDASSALEPLAGPEATVTDYPKQTTTYTLKILLNSGETVSVSKTVTVMPKVEPVPVPVPVPMPTGDVRLGVNVIGGNGNAARQAGNAGARFFVVLGNYELASQLKDAWPDAVVVFRPDLTGVNYLPSVEQAWTALHGASDKRLIHILKNENEQRGWGASDIAAHAALDIGVWQRCKAVGAIFAAGSPSVGTPALERDDVANAFKATYAPAYNAGMWFDMHLYSPAIGRIGMSASDCIWYERRWEMLFTRCGFNINSPARIIATETGLDTGDDKGFVGNGVNDERIQAWSRWWVTLQAQPVNGQPSPFVGGAVYQLGGNGDPRWNGFEISGKLAVFQACGWGKG